ncbi:MAG TPA: cation:proton antiporter [Actinomycetota bacterium]|jgi:Kef-type K+ transport system membrane component KefB
MPDVSFNGLVIVAAVAFVAPLVLGLFPRVRLPAVVLEILLGILIGPSGLGWVKPDLPIQVLSVVGLGFLLFLAGLEVELGHLRGRLLRLPLLGFLVSLAIGVGVGLILHAAGQARSPLLIGITLVATSLGLVVPVLKDAGETTTDFGQLVIAGGTVADFGAVILLTLFFSGEASGVGTKLLLLAIFVLMVAVAGASVGRVGRSMRVSAVLLRLQDTTAQIRVRGAVLLLIAFVALAARFGLETILGAFLAGVVVGLVDRDAMMTHPHFRVKLEGIGYGFLVPVFFVSSGLTFDLDALLSSPSTILRTPLFLIALLAVRGIPALLYRPLLGDRRTVAAGLLQATSLPFIVVASRIGVSLGLVSAANAAALVAAGLLSVVIFPVVALGLFKEKVRR